MLAMREHMRDEEMHRIFKCPSIWESVASIWFLFGSQALKGPQRELLRFLLESRYFVGGLFKIPYEQPHTFCMGVPLGDIHVQAVDSCTLLLVTWRGKSFKRETKTKLRLSTY